MRGHMVRHQTVENLKPCLLSLRQCHMLLHADCDDGSGPSRLGPDPHSDWLICLQNDLSTRSRGGPHGVNGFGEQ